MRTIRKIDGEWDIPEHFWLRSSRSWQAVRASLFGTPSYEGTTTMSSALWITPGRRTSDLSGTPSYEGTIIRSSALWITLGRTLAASGPPPCIWTCGTDVDFQCQMVSSLISQASRHGPSAFPSAFIFFESASSDPSPLACLTSSIPRPQRYLRGPISG